MRQYSRLLASLGVVAVLAGCEQTSDVGVPDSRDGVLRSTDGSKDFGDYVVYFNALNTDQLTPDISRKYAIVRSKNRAMLNISIHRKQPGGLTTAVTGGVSATAINLTGQLKSITLREIREGDAIYYIGELPIADAETLIYTIDVTPANEPSRFTVRFQKQFFVD